MFFLLLSTCIISIIGEHANATETALIYGAVIFLFINETGVMRLLTCTN